MKFIHIKFSNGEVWRIPAQIVARHRAHYYAGKEAPLGSTDYDQAYTNEEEYALKNNDELIDWAKNSMDWLDVKDVARKVETNVGVVYDIEFPNAEMEVKDEDL